MKKSKNYTFVESNTKENYTNDGRIVPNHYFSSDGWEVINILEDQLTEEGYCGMLKFLVMKYLIRVEECPPEVRLRAYKKAKYYLNELVNKKAKTSTKLEPEVTDPAYYHKHELQVVDIAEIMFTEEEVFGAYAGIILKYILRAEKKEGIEDYQKAYWFLERLISFTESKI